MHNHGSCQCGAVTFDIEGEPLRMAQCHCADCRKASGTGHMSQAFFNKSQVTIHGKTQTFENKADSGNDRIRHFCPVCGGRLFSENNRAPDTIGIAVGVLDDSSWFKPGSIVFSSQKPAWDFMDPDVPSTP